MRIPEGHVNRKSAWGDKREFSLAADCLEWYKLRRSGAHRRWVNSPGPSARAKDRAKPPLEFESGKLTWRP